MTKIKNTKKGMAKKTLSMSLVVAMLATSNVPVWAAEFSDGTDVSVATEAPTPEETTDTTEFSDDTAETPVVDDTTDAPVAQEVDDGTEINKENYTVSNLKLSEVGSWGKSSVTVESGSITNKGVAVTGFKYTWMADGVEASGKNATGDVTNLSDLKYTPSKDDYGKTISLRIYQRSNNATIFSVVLTGGVVKAYDLTAVLSHNTLGKPLTFGKGFTTTDITTDSKGYYTTRGTVVYNGEENKPTPTTPYDYVISGINITNNQINWHYEVEGNDFTNVTDKTITVYGTIDGTDDPSSPAYGFTGKTAKAVYTITPLKITKDNLKPSLVTTSLGYTGAVQSFGKSDVKLEVEVNADTQKKVDITEALKPEFSVKGTDKAVGTGYSVKSDAWMNFADTDAAQKILKNFDTTGTLGEVKTENTYAIVKRNLSECTGKITKEYSISDFKGKPTASINPVDVKLTGKDGKSFTLDSLGNNVVIQVNKVVFDAANADKKGVVEGAVTISYSSDSTNVEGSITLPITLVNRSIGTVWATFDNGVNEQLVTSKTATTAEVPYTGEAYTLDSKKIKAIEVTFLDEKNQSHKLTTSEYSVSYENNVNAGYAKVIITGKDSYAGSVKEVYFKIKPDTVTDTVAAGDFTAKAKVTVNSANNYDASLYKDAMGLKFETALDGSADKKLALIYDKDYTVKYYYVKTSNPNALDTTTKIKAAAGTNVPGDYVFAVATLAKNGNYTKAIDTDEIIAYSKIVKKSISNVSITVEKSSYTFTGEEISADVVVKDGTVTLDKGIDYTLKYKDNINAGTATVIVVPTKGSEYDDGTTASATFEITPAKAEDVSVTLVANGTKAVAVDGEANTFRYSGRQVKPLVSKVMLGKVDVTKYFDVTYVSYGDNISAGKEMGSVTISPKTNNTNFTGTKTQKFNIQGKELIGTLKLYYTDKTKVSVDPITKAVDLGRRDNFTYDGEAQKFGSETFTPATGIKATKDTDYEIKYINNVNAGTGFVAVVAKGNYEANTLNVNLIPGNRYGIWYSVEKGVLYQHEWDGSSTEKSVLQKNIVDLAYFNIEASYFTARNITVSNGAYAGGKPVTPKISVAVNGKTLVEGTDYKLVLSSIDGKTTPDKFVDATTTKPYQVEVVPMGGYSFNDTYGSSTFVWGIDKKDLKDCSVSVDKNLKATVTNGNVIEEKENFTVKDNGDGTATVSVVDGGKNYTGSVNVEIGGRKVGAPMISNVKVVGNKATVVLSDEVDGASGYDYVISTDKDCITSKNYTAVNKNQAKTSTAFKYVDQGTYYAYCHAWTRDANGKKVFGEWSNGFQFSVTATTPDAPVIKSVKVSGSTVKVTYELSANATGYDVVLGTSSKKDNGELRPYNYGAHKVLNLKESTVTATFKNVPAGTWTVGMHAFNRTSLDGKKVFSPWSNLKTAKVK